MICRTKACCALRIRKTVFSVFNPVTHGYIQKTGDRVRHPFMNDYFSIISKKMIKLRGVYIKCFRIDALRLYNSQKTLSRPWSDLR